MKDVHKPKRAKPRHIGKNLTDCLKRQSRISGCNTTYQPAQWGKDFTALLLLCAGQRLLISHVIIQFAAAT